MYAKHMRQELKLSSGMQIKTPKKCMTQFHELRYANINTQTNDEQPKTEFIKLQGQTDDLCNNFEVVKPNCVKLTSWF